MAGCLSRDSQAFPADWSGPRLGGPAQVERGAAIGGRLDHGREDDDYILDHHVVGEEVPQQVSAGPRSAVERVAHWPPVRIHASRAARRAETQRPAAPPGPLIHALRLHHLFRTVFAVHSGDYGPGNV